MKTNRSPGVGRTNQYDEMVLDVDNIVKEMKSIRDQYCKF
jgi:hypothetical protein